MNNTPQNKIASSDNIFRPTFWSEIIIKPKRDWRILMIIFLVFVLASVGYDFYMYKQIVNGDMYVSVNRNELVVEGLKSSDLQKTLDNFETKKTIITTLKVEDLVDPSI